MSTAAPDPRTLVRLLALAIVLGVLGALGGSVFLLAVEEGQRVLFEHVPDALGWSSAPWWYAAILLLIGAGVVAIGQAMPGATGKGPLTGFHFDTSLAIVPSIVVAAVGTLMFGFALGPEAPLIILGTSIGAIVARRGDARARQLAMLLGDRKSTRLNSSH